MTLLIALNVVLSVVVLALVAVVFAMTRQIGILYERVAPLGALVTDAGPTVGQVLAARDVPLLGGGTLRLGGAADHRTLLFFLSPTCPLCKKLVPLLPSLVAAEPRGLKVVLVGDGSATEHRGFADNSGLPALAHVLSDELGVLFRVNRLPFAVLLDSAGVVKGKGLVNNREQLESLLTAEELQIAAAPESPRLSHGGREPSDA